MPASRLLILLIVALLPPLPALRGQEASGLEEELLALVKGFEGEVGIFVEHRARKVRVALAAEELYPTASLVKVPIMGALMARVERGELRWDGKHAYDPERWSRGGEDLFAGLKAGTPVSLSKIVFAMESLSDNTASVWAQELAGGGQAINAWLAKEGFAHTRVNSRTPGRERAYQRHGWGQTTPREMVEMLWRIRDRRWVSPRASRRMHRALVRSYWTKEALSAVPISVQVASKQGAVSRSRSEAFLVHAPGGDYACCVITRNQKDRSWRDDNAGFVLLRKVSALLWRTFGDGRAVR